MLQQRRWIVLLYILCNTSLRAQKQLLFGWRAETGGDAAFQCPGDIHAYPLASDLPRAIVQTLDNGTRDADNNPYHVLLMHSSDSDHFFL
ncbi:unnamed protein product [Peronospora effusa]|uniref:Secreted protein n=1 Tax=Peronospora effusa TaxID=542832 RepID=A0A3M6VJB5_9STRA|nr:hypothetical protein DD238_004818 [Peronospora effusa]CAI5705730.1 unnamed protein product [Peronospora effusa]